MPLSSTPAVRAFAQLRQNRIARWPDGRRDGRRLDGIVLPAAKPSFRLVRGERIFTAGSCFARNVEVRLAQLGFRVPACELSLPQDERTSDSANDILNKYNPQSIVNELIWAFEQPFPDAAYLEMEDGLWHDPHLAGNVRPAPLERLRERRAMVTNLFRELPRCRTIIVTLGLIEAWYDKTTGLYLNGPPPAAAVVRHPLRFRFDVLSHREVMKELERMWALIEKHGHRRARMLVTVSPVPLRATYTDQDVLVANSYSKSVLRAAVGEFAAAHRLVDYFPSYEAAMLTARPTAFMEDNRHVAPSLVGAIMDRVMQTYVRAADEEPEETPAEESDRPVSQQVRDHIKMGRSMHARRLLSELAARGEYAAAGYNEFQFRYVYAKTLLDTDAPLEAQIQLERCVELEPESAMAHYGLGRLLSRLQRPLGSEEAFRRASTLDPSNLDARLRLARLEARNGKLPDAEQTAMAVLAMSPDHEETIELLAEIRALAAADWGNDRGVPPLVPLMRTSGGWLLASLRRLRSAIHAR